MNIMNNVFLSGEKIDLCVPMDDDFEQWAGWFNSQNTTQFLEQGKYPNTPDQQRLFYQQALASGRFLTLIKTKDAELLGVISLSEIDDQKSSCQIALVCPEKSKSATLAPLEAMALCTQHAFDRFGLQRVWAGHAYPGLAKWVQKREILGFKTDGVIPQSFRHGRMISDSIRTSITYDRYMLLIERRNGMLWPGEDKAKRMLAALKSQKPLAQRVDEAIKTLHREHDDLLAEIEQNA